MYKRPAVLIETWWNVNTYKHGFTTATIIVLIETWWNVNFISALTTALEGYGFNRNMVECKYL